MAFDELKQDLIDANADMRSYIETSEEYLKLKAFKILVKSVTSVVQIILIGAVLFLALFFVTLAVSLALNEALDSFYYGFLIMGLFYVLIGVLCYFFRATLQKPVLRKFSKHYFD